MKPELHPDIAHLEFLLGTWRGTGRGAYPTIDSFEYTEESTFSHVGKPFLAYAQRTKGVDGLPLHAEVGYLRSAGSDGIELVLAHPFGITEIHTGFVEGTCLRLESTNVARTPTAKEVQSLRRTIDVSGDEMRYRVDMSAVGEALQFHLEATLKRRV